MSFITPRSNSSIRRTRKIAACLIAFVLGGLIVAILTGLGAASVPQNSLDDEVRYDASILLSGACQTTDVYENGASTVSDTVCAVDGSVIIRGRAMVGSSSSPINGIHANGTVWLHGTAAAYGDVAATETVLIGGKACAGSIEEFASPMSHPEVPISTYSRQADEGIYWDGTCKIGNSCSVGSMYVAGDLIVSNDAKVDLCGTVYVEGDIRLSGGCRIEGPGVLVAEGNVTLCGDMLLDSGSDRIVVSVNGDIKVTGNSCVVATLCAPNGGVFLAGNCTIYGCVIGLSVTGGGSASVDTFPG